MMMLKQPSTGFENLIESFNMRGLVNSKSFAGEADSFPYRYEASE